MNNTARRLDAFAVHSKSDISQSFLEVLIMQQRRTGAENSYKRGAGSQNHTRHPKLPLRGYATPGRVQSKHTNVDLAAIEGDKRWKIKYKSRVGKESRPVFTNDKEYAPTCSTWGLRGLFRFISWFAIRTRQSLVRAFLFPYFLTSFLTTAEPLR